MIKVWFDGWCNKHQYGKGGIGVVIEKNDATPHTISQYIGEGKYIGINVARYMALYSALIYLEHQNLTNDEIVIHSDSRRVIGEMTGRRRIRKGLSAAVAVETKKVLGRLSNVSLHWISRQENTMADALSKVAVINRNQRRV